MLSIKDGSGKTNDTTFVGYKNPLHYRGYYYDSETKLYDLQSRYYNPERGSLINADGLVSTGQGLIGTNMFAYCDNNPVMRMDPSGEFWGAVAIIAVVGFVVASSAGCSANPSKPSNYVENRSTDQNCYSYAFNLPQTANPGDYSVNKSNLDYMYKSKSAYTTREITGYIERAMKALNKSVRVVILHLIKLTTNILWQ